jgi:hypothetical protein
MLDRSPTASLENGRFAAEWREGKMVGHKFQGGGEVAFNGDRPYWGNSPVLHQQRDPDFWQGRVPGAGQIEGEAEGEITGEEIEIAPIAVLATRITANRLKVGGQVNGEIVARERIEV